MTKNERNILGMLRQMIHLDENWFDIFSKGFRVQHELNEHRNHPIEYRYCTRIIQNFQKNDWSPPHNRIQFERSPGQSNSTARVTRESLLRKNNLPNFEQIEPIVDCIFSDGPLINHPHVRTEESADWWYNLRLSKKIRIKIDPFHSFFVDFSLHPYSLSWIFETKKDVNLHVDLDRFGCNCVSHQKTIQCSTHLCE